MKIKKFKRPDINKVVLVWDRETDFVAMAQRAVSQVSDDARIYVVHAMPHESIYSSGTFSFNRSEKSAYERKLQREFFGLVAGSDVLRRAKFEVVFGDRLHEIVRLAEVIKASAILMSRFEQSSFSKWVHGDLNKRIAETAACRVMFLDEVRAGEMQRGRLTKEAAE